MPLPDFPSLPSVTPAPGRRAIAGLGRFHDEVRREAHRELMGAAAARYALAGIGRHRAVFHVGPRRVLKIPLDAGGVESNLREARLSRPGSARLARAILARIIPFPCLLMERVIPLPRGIALDLAGPWILDFDDGQVGLDRAGRIKAFDYGT